MTYDTINDAQTMQGGAAALPKNEKGKPMDKSIGDGVTMKPGEGRGGRGAFSPGDVIAGRYVVESILGEGGMGIVYQCLDRVGGVKVAVKCLPPEVSRNAEEMEDIRANYRLVSDLHHQNIAGARTLELDESTGDYYLVMDLAPGMSLKRWMKRNPQATMEAKLAILRQVAAALDYAHARKIIHRDVKPENVMVDDDGGVKVLDFGLAAQIRSSQSRTSAAVTSKGGTPGYKSPEQWRGKAQREPADVYSFGVMAYWMLVGELPFDGDDLAVLGHAVLTEPVGPVAGLPAHMNAALAKALAKAPEDRFASCGEFVDALEGKVKVSRRGAETRRSGGGRAALVVAALCIAALAGGVWWWMKGWEETKGTQGIIGTNVVQVSSVSSVPSPAPISIKESPAAPVAVNKSPPTNDTSRAVAEEAKRKAAEAQAIELAIEAGVVKGRLQRISADDGFSDKMNSLLDAFARAEGCYKAKLWNKAASGFTSFTNDCKKLAILDKCRNDAKASRETAVTAKDSANNAGAEQYTASRWEGAKTLMDEGAKEFGKMLFDEAKDKFDLAAKQFNLAAAEAPKERKRQIDEQREAEAKANAERERRAKWRKEGEPFTINEPHGFNMTMKWCPKGSFTMGSPSTEDGRDDDERQHEVTLTKGFWMGETEVTQGQWKLLMNGETVVDLARKGLQDDTLYAFSEGKKTLREFWGMTRDGDPNKRCGDLKDDVPVYNVSWDEAVRFCRKLTQRERSEGRIPDGYEYRLPTEAEWEYACRAETTSALPNGCEIRILGKNNATALDYIAWYGGNSSVGFEGRGLDTAEWPEKQYPGGYAFARKVKDKSKQPNNWGLHDMIGNVFEWCGDWYGEYPYGSVTDPVGAERGAFRVCRGGGWDDGARYCRSADRGRGEPCFRGNYLGFRVALAPSH